MGRIYTTQTGEGMLSAKEIMECFNLFFSLVETEVYTGFLMSDLSHIPGFFAFLAIADAGWSGSVELTY